MPSVHPLPVNPTTGQQPLAALRFGTSNTNQISTSSGGVNREILKQLQDVAWSDEEVSKRARRKKTPFCAH
jgi:CCR4-NOT transcription complex subunit 4